MDPLRLLAPALALATVALADPGIPHLERDAHSAQLVVDGKPLLLQGGELTNSNGEPDYLRPSWDKLVGLNLNSLVIPVYWGVIEPVEGKFDFTTVDGLLADARSHRFHLILLWFGSWKNSMSCYVPDWVKTNTDRFPRSRDSLGRSTEIMTPFSDENRDTDARAFSALMRHLREADGSQHTVVIVQVENEIGMIPEVRDRTAAADKAFASEVPEALLQYLAAHHESLAPELRRQWEANGSRTSGTWVQVFGDSIATAEYFTAWNFARYTDSVAAAGKREYPLPMYANAALIRPGYKPGQYPSGGPLPHLIDIWRAAAPSLDFISPDIYFPNFTEWADRYARGPSNPLFVPEALRSSAAAVNALYAYGSDDALGFGPYGIESIAEPAAGLLRQSNDLIRQLAPLIVTHRGDGTMTALLPPTDDMRKPQEVSFGGLVLDVSYERLESPGLADGVINEAGDKSTTRVPLPAGAIAIQLGPDEFLFGGIGATVTFSSPTPGDPQIGILSCEEGRYVDGRWQHIRWLNGDQTNQGRHIRLEPGHFTLQRVRLYRYH